MSEVRHLFLVILTVFAAACTETLVDNTVPSTAPAGEQAHVIYVSDGDSLIVDLDGTEQKVRLIGINAPEREECFGPESRDRLHALLDDQTVTLVADIESTDQYDRLLRYVYLDGRHINEEMVRLGNVMARSYAPNTAHQEAFDDAQTEARDSGAGMWAEGVCAIASTLRIAAIQADAPGPDDENLNGEWVEIENTGPDPVNLTGWSLRDAESVNRYSFPSGMGVEPGEAVRVFTGCGDDSPTGLHWCSATPVWNNRGDVAFLLDPAGKIADRYEY